MESAASDRKRACPFADRGDDEHGAGSNNNADDNTSANSEQGSDSARVRLVEASGCDGR
jgi:hypothetical protein